MPSDTARKTVLPPSREDQARWEATRLRRRIMTAQGWELDLGQHMAKHLDPARMEAWGPPSLALNMYKSVVSQLSVLYTANPVVQNPALTPEGEEWLQSQNIWSQHSRLCREVIGLREGLIRLAWNPGHHASPGGITLRRVNPDYVVAYASPLAPTVPLRIEEAVQRRDPHTKEEVWTWDVWDISDQYAPVFQIVEDTKERKDVTHQYAPDMAGHYPYVDLESGVPYLPWVMYHAEDTGGLWGWGEWSELVHGTMDLAVLASFWIHSVKDASWAQKYGLNVRLRGMSTAGQGKAARSRISTDPASILLFETDAGQAGGLGSFAQSADPNAIIDAIRKYVTMVSTSMGLSASDLEVAQAESGVAIQLRQSAIRRMQKQYTPHFRRGDQELLHKVAMITNLYSGDQAPPLPTSGWEVSYPALPMSKEELHDLFELRGRELDLGLISRVDILMERNPGMTREQALDKLQQIQREQALLGLTNPNPQR